MASSARKSKAASERKGASDSAKQENLKFDHFPVCIQEVSTAIHLITCQEEDVLVAALSSLDRYAAKTPTNIGVLLEKGLKPECLLLMAFKKDVLPALSPARIYAAKLLARFVKIPRVRDELAEDGMGQCLDCLERNESEPLNEFSSLVLAELTTGVSVSYAATLLISPITKNLFPLKVLFSRLLSSKDPDVVHNCLRNIWQLLIAASAAPDSRQYTDIIDDIEAMALIPPLFKSNYPAIQILSLAVAYEAAIRSSIAHKLLSSSFPALLELLETPSHRLLHCIVLALIRRLVLPPAADSEENNSREIDPALSFVTIDGPKRLLEYQRLYKLDPGDVRFWSTVAILALYTSTSAADNLIDQRQHHREIPSFIKDTDSNIAVAAAYALFCVRNRKIAMEEILQSSAPRDLVALAARWPDDEDVEPRYRQTLEGCALAAAVLKGLVRENRNVRKALIFEPQESSTPDKDSSSGSQRVNAPKVSEAIESLKDILERVGMLPDDCITSVLSIIATVASSEDLRSAVAGNHGLVVAVTNCLEPPSYVQLDPPVVELLASWPGTSTDLERMVASRLTRDRMWRPENPGPELGHSLPEVKESAILALGVLMLDNAAAETFIASKGPHKIRKILEKEERRFGRNSLLEAALVLIIQCPTIVANAFVADGTLAWMLTEAALSRHIPFTAQWHACIASLLRSNPSAKFQVTGLLNPEDSTGDLFYVVSPAAGKYEATPPIAELMAMPPTPHKHVFAASFAPSLAPVACVAPSKSARSRRRASRVAKSFLVPVEAPALEPDEDLMEMERELREELQRPGVGMRTMIKAIAKLVWEGMAGPVKDGGFKKERHFEELKVEFGRGDVIPLGMVRMGGPTERAILFKVLADRLGLPVALKRGPYGRCWVEVALVEIGNKEVEEELCAVPTPGAGDEALPPPADKPVEAEKEEAVKEEAVKEESVKEGAVVRTRRFSKANVVSFKEKGSNGDRNEKKRKTLEKKEWRYGLEESSSLPHPYIPQEKLNIPARVYHPNHVIDLMNSECHLYPIGSNEANLYCGFAPCKPEFVLDWDCHLLCDIKDDGDAMRKLQEKLHFPLR